MAYAAKIRKLSSNTAKSKQQFNMRNCTQNRPCYGPLKKCTCLASYPEVVFGK